MAPNEFKDMMEEISKSDDTELRHMDADDLMCEALKELGYSEGIEIFEAMYKWYA